MTALHTTLSDLSNDLAALVAATAPAVVAVHGAGRGPASGLLWQPGVVVTADETLAGDGDLAIVLPSGERVAATVAGRDPSTDVAVLRCQGAPPAATVAAMPAASGVAAGELAVAIGSAAGGTVAALGMVSFAGGPWRSRSGGDIAARLVIDARLPAVAEGGVVVTADGRFVGMAAFGPRRRVIAIPAATIAAVVPVILDRGHIPRGYLGVGLQGVALGDGDGRRGAMVVTLDADGPARAAGIHQGDIIVAVAGAAVTGPRSLYRQLGPDAVGTTATVELVRAGAPVSVAVTVAARPAP